MVLIFATEHNVGHVLEHMTVGGGIAVAAVALIPIAFIVFVMAKVL